MKSAGVSKVIGLPLPDKLATLKSGGMVYGPFPTARCCSHCKSPIPAADADGK